MINFDSLDYSLSKSLRQIQIRTSERFRCKEPLAVNLGQQLKENIPDFCEPKSKEKLIYFARDIGQWVSINKKTLMRFFGISQLSPQPNYSNKPQPSFIEAVYATLVRCEWLTLYAKYLKKLNIGCILGGSLSYGKFFNIRQAIGEYDASQQSDIDLILVGNFQDLLDKLITGYDWDYITQQAKIDKSNKIMEAHDSELVIVYGLRPLLEQGIKLAQEYRIPYDELILSKKTKINLSFDTARLIDNQINNCSFIVSLHLFSKDGYNRITNPYSFEEIKNQSTRFTDLRIDSNLGELMVYSTMEGTPVPDSIRVITKKTREIKFGISKATVSICQIPAYFYWENRYISGIYQNLIIPAFDVICDDQYLTINNGIDTLKKFLINECLYERMIFLDSTIKLSRLHPRYPIFLRPIVDGIDNLCDLSITTKKDRILVSYLNKDSLNNRKKFHEKYGKVSLNEQIFNEISISNIGWQNANVLDLGCGDGNFLSYLASYGHRGLRIGIDLVKPKIEIYDNHSTYICGDVNELLSLLEGQGYKDVNFEIIVAIHMLYHIENVENLLEQAIKKLSPDGLFLATTNSMYSFYSINNLFRESLAEENLIYFSEQRYNRFCSETAVDLFRDYFKKVRTVTTETDINIENSYDVISYIESNYDNFEIPIEFRKRISARIRKKISEYDHKKITDRRIITIITGKI